MFDKFLKKSTLVFILSGLTIAGFSACGEEEDDDDTTDTPDTETPTPTPTTVTFTVDTTQQIQGTADKHSLATVEATKQVFMVGAFNDWAPQDTNYVLHDDGKNGDATSADGIFTIQLSFPLEGKDGTGKGIAKTWNAGDAGFTFKFTKTKLAPDGDGWDNGIKEAVLDSGITDGTKCPTTVTLKDGLGLWQVGKKALAGTEAYKIADSNLTFDKIPSTDTTVAYKVDAWEGDAKAAGFSVCQ